MRIVMASIVDPASFRGGAGTVTRALVRALESAPLAARVEVVASPARGRWQRRWRRLAAFARAELAASAAKLEFQRSRRLLGQILVACRQPTDLVLLNGDDHFWLLPHLPPEVPVAFVAHNVEHELYRSQLESGGGLLRLLPRLAARDLARLRAAEIAGWRGIGRGIFVSSADEAAARAVCPRLDSLVVPPLFEGPQWSGARPVAAGASLELGVLANFDWWPNRQGVDWLLRELLPRLDRAVRVHLFGSGGERWRGRDERLVVHGFVADLDRFWSGCDLALTPAFAGGGVVVKLAEAIYHRKPVVATRFAAHSLGLEPDPAVAVLDSAEQWAALLDGGEGRALARRRPAAGLARRFALVEHLPALHEFARRAAARELAR